MFGLGFSEILVIVIAAAVLLFGSKKIVELARSMGRVSGEFKKGKREVERELESEAVVENTPVKENENTAPSVAQSETENKV